MNLSEMRIRILEEKYNNNKLYSQPCHYGE